MDLDALVGELLDKLCRNGVLIADQDIGIGSVVVLGYRPCIPLDVLEQCAGVVLLQLFLQRLFQPEGDVGVLAGVAVHLGGGEVAHVALSLSFRADEVFDGDGCVVQVDVRQVVHVVPQLGLQHVVRDHRVEQRAFHLYAVVGQHQQVVLDVLSHLQGVGVFQQGPELGDGFHRLFPLGGYRDVESLVFGVAEAHSHQFGGDGIGAGGLRIYTENLLC